MKQILITIIGLVFMTYVAIGTVSCTEVGNVTKAPNQVSVKCKDFMKQSARSDQESDIQEAVFRCQFRHNSSGLQQNASVYCLSLAENKNPDDEFMKRFQGHKPPVKKVSQCTICSGEGVKDAETGKQGLILQVTSIKWISNNEVEVEGGYYEAEESSSGNTYRVQREGDQWAVREDKMNWIS